MVNSIDNYYLSFQYCPGIGPKTFQVIKKAFAGDLEKAWHSFPNAWEAMKFSPKIIEALTLHKQSFNLDQAKEKLARLGIIYFSQLDSNFPALLKQIADCPIGLFIKGKILTQDSKALAVVGTRKVTAYGREVTEKFVQQLTNLGFTIISGLARGVDGIAHRSCLENGGRTLAVLGCGVEQIYPPEHRELAKLISENGALISEYPPGTVPIPGNFPSRNRIVSGLSLGVLVTEGASKSGSKITALAALEQNREVFAIPGPINSPMSAGPAELIQMGAKLVLSVKDILTELQLDNGQINQIPQGGNGKQVSMLSKPQFNDPVQEKIWLYLIQGTQHIDDIVRFTSLSASDITTCLSLMELQGMVKNLGDGNYMIK